MENASPFRMIRSTPSPAVINLGSPFRIALGRAPKDEDRQPSFVAGLFPGPVHIESDGLAECVQVDFTLLGAFRFYGGAIVDLTAQMVEVEHVLGEDGCHLVDRIAEAKTWRERFEVLESVIVRRCVHTPSPEVALALAMLERSGGSVRISDIASEIGWSRRHLGRQFTNHLGVAPKTVAQMLRFHRASELARDCAQPDWATIALQTGFADQAHLTRTFHLFSGETPTQWWNRVLQSHPEVLRTGGG